MKNATLSVGGTDLSDHISSVAVEVTTPEVDLTSMGSAYQEFAGGIPDATITATFFQDFAASSVDSVLWPLSQNNGTTTVVVKPTNAAASATNPTYTMTARVYNFSPMGGAVSDAATTDVSFRNAGTAGIVKGTV